MRSRGLVVAIAIVLAVAAAAAVVLYTQGVKNDAVEGGTLETVIVATQEIPANQRLDPLIDQGLFTEIDVPAEALVGGAVTDVSQLRGATSTTPILANEQIPAKRLSTAEENLNTVGVSEGHVGVSVELDAPQGGVGIIKPGDDVQVFATYQGVTLIPGSLRSYLTQPTTAATPKKDVPDFTVTLIGTVRVLRIQNPEVDSETGRSDSSRIQVTLDLLPEDAQNLVFAQENARVWLGLLPPNEEGTQPPASTVPIELLLGAKLG
ncbi:MAG: Flp pilus assembly protein CpaB [Actinomycetota bacterium]